MLGVALIVVGAVDAWFINAESGRGRPSAHHLMVCVLNLLLGFAHLMASSRIANASRSQRIAMATVLLCNATYWCYLYIINQLWQVMLHLYIIGMLMLIVMMALSVIFVARSAWLR
jgi:hypothetical protein